MQKKRTTAAVVAAPLPWRRLLLACTTALLIGLLTSTGRADDEGQYKVVDGIGVYYGLMPAGIVRGHNPSHPERSMHGGPPSRHEYHLVVALFDATTRARIDNAKVSARISPLGATGPVRQLDPMWIADTVSYGGYFPLRPGDRYAIHLEIERPGAARSATVDFLYDHRSP